MGMTTSAVGLRGDALRRFAEAQVAASKPYSPPLWYPYEGGAAILLAIVLVVVAAGFAYAGKRLRVPLIVSRADRVAAGFMIAIWLLSIATYLPRRRVRLRTADEAGLPRLRRAPTPRRDVRRRHRHVLRDPLSYATVGMEDCALERIRRHGRRADALRVSLRSDRHDADESAIPDHPMLYRALFFLPLFLVEFSRRVGSVTMGRGTVLVCHPTIDNALRWSKLKLAPMMRSTPIVQGHFLSGRETRPTRWTEDVWSFARQHASSRLIMVRGRGDDAAPRLARVLKERNDRTGLLNPYSKRFYHLGVSTLKMALYRDLQKTDPKQPGFVTFPSASTTNISKSWSASAGRRSSATVSRSTVGPRMTGKTTRRSDTMVIATGAALEARRLWPGGHGLGEA